ncbi:monofunctional biosynthetic peptidoglycan transglycosylase [Methylobacillus rhizosphaerae]|uniref:Biosynthetic peptidoglycan transglycosylase n=1 Tax=Methylobacillus rhizosphaerae TaxID=551994 RepID=A0A238XTQ6_9PROT|nr:monofunctional biosynthetic peptidoglycan transglycosylase [Methylobacillus rhizosphaerae]SNR61901.1 monofunctional biosynthetic peptidoglycan transglycosylase [Methylobacillus rhizosphaerae]
MIKRLLWQGLLLALVLIVLYQLWIFINILWWVDHNPGSSAFMRTSLSVLREDNAKATLKHEWVEYNRISRHLKRAVIASEDAKFVGHEGFDWDGIQKAYEKNWQKGKIVAGGSTISQQLAKNLFLSTKRTPWRKLEEAVITWMLESMMSKRRIFEIYLNVIEWGNGVFGAEAAARHYYRTSAANLDSAQAARLAAMIPNPRYYDQHREARGLVRKAAIIESRMRHAAVP